MRARKFRCGGVKEKDDWKFSDVGGNVQIAQILQIPSEKPLYQEVYNRKREASKGVYV